MTAAAASFADLTRERPFIRMWSARLAGTAGSQLLLVAIGWHMYELTASAWDLGLVGLHQFVPALLPATLLVGVDFIWRRKPVFGAVSLDLFAVLLGGAVALLPIYAKDILATGPWGLGLLRSAPAVGALAMSIALTRRPVEHRVGRALLVAVAVFGPCMVVFGLSRSFVLSLVALAVSGAADMVSVVIRQALVQLETPDAMRGRVSAVNSIFIGASNQLGEFESGATAALFGPVGSVVAGGMGTVLMALAWFRLFPSLAGRDRIGASSAIE